MVFPTSPTVGQVFSSGGRSWVWTGSTWDSPSSATAALSGLTHIRTTDFTAQSAVLINNCFSSEYDNYRIIISELVVASGDPQLSWQVSSNGTAVSTTTYGSQRLYSQGTSVGGSSASSQTSGNVGFVGPASNGTNFVVLEIFSPFLASRTKISSSINYAPLNIEINNSQNNNLTSYDGIRFALSSSTMSGKIRIYGYRNA
jgi:hypothetical protein